jgi:hypothetical protein
MYCETCPVRSYCKAYGEAVDDNNTSYCPQEVVRVKEWDDIGCPLVRLIKKVKVRLDI